LVYTGKIGTGFNDKLQKEMMTEMKKLVVDKPPFTETPDVQKPSRFRPHPLKTKVTWLKPKLVCEVSYAEITSDGVMRHPSFEAMRIDKDAKDVHEEKEKQTASVVQQQEPENIITMKKKSVKASKVATVKSSSTKKDLTAKLLKGSTNK